MQNLIRGQSQREAYKNSYNAEKMKDETIDTRASLLSKEYKVSKRYNELKNKLEREALMTRADLLKGLKLAFEMALGIKPTPVAVKDVVDGNIEFLELSARTADLKAVSSIALQIAKLEGWDKESQKVVDTAPIIQIIDQRKNNE